MATTKTVSERQISTPLWQRLITSSLLSERAITLSTFIVAAGFMASKVLGLAREVLIARAFGTTAPLDAFRAANTFSDMLDSVIAGVTIAAVFIPVFSTHLVKGEEGRREGWRFASAVLNDMFLLMTVVAGIGILFAPQLVEYIVAPGFDAAQTELASGLMRIVLIAAIVFGVSGTVTGILQAQNRFALTAMAGPLHNVGMIFGVLVLVPRIGVYGLAWGVVIGSLLHLGIQIPGLIRSRMMWFATLGGGQGSMRELLRLLVPRIITTNIVSVTRLIMINLASFLGEGSISALSYAYSLWQFPETLIGTAIAVAVFPRLSQRVAAKDVRGFQHLFKLALVTILALAIPCALVAIFFAQPIVALVLQRGAFGTESTAFVARVLQFYALAIVGESVLEVATRVFYAEHDSKTPMFVTLGSMVLRIGLMIWWRDTLGAPGLALAYAIGVCVESSALLLIARRRFAERGI